MSERVSIREFAKSRGVSDTAIRKAIAHGKIVGGVGRDPDGTPFIIPAVATQELSMYETRARAPKPVPDKAPKPQRMTAPSPPQNAPVIPPPYTPPTEAPAPPKGSLAAAKLHKAQVDAKRAEVGLKKEMGLLIEKDKVYAALFDLANKIKQNLTTIPDRFIDELRTAPTRNDAHTILANAIAEALEKLADTSQIDLTPQSYDSGS